MAPKSHTVAGIMSGTSLDGMDLVVARFYRVLNHWKYQIQQAVTLEYTEEWKRKLREAATLPAEEFLLLHNEYGRYTGDAVTRFLSDAGLHAGLVASHGHTIFHQPAKQFTFQLGAGAVLASQCGITTVSDFRTTDVALGGQGAPLVPVGDELLFNNFGFCLNLGGFSNISNQQHGRRIACDISPVNMVANSLAMRAGYTYDNNGEMGSRGTIHTGLVDRLNALDFYTLPAPKSLGREWVETSFMPVLDQYNIPPEDLLRSVYEHIAVQISRYINSFETGEVLVTGGGAFNTFLVDLIRQKSRSVLVIPDDQLVKFKEALIFALLGLLRYRKEINCLASVTGASRNSSSGIIHLA